MAMLFMFMVIPMTMANPRKEGKAEASHVHVAMSNATTAIRRGTTKRTGDCGRARRVRTKSLMEVRRNNARTKEVQV